MIICSASTPAHVMGFVREYAKLRAEFGCAVSAEEKRLGTWVNGWATGPKADLAGLAEATLAEFLDRNSDDNRPGYARNTVLSRLCSGFSGSNELYDSALKGALKDAACANGIDLT